MNDARLLVHTVTWNSQTYLPALFASLDEQGVPHRMVVVDNASTDGTVNWLLSERPHATVLRNMRNVGFSRANNQAIQLALAGHEEADQSKRYVLLCNPDIELHPACLERLQEVMDKHPELDAVQPKLLQARRKNGYSDIPETLRTDTIDSLGIAMTRARRPYNIGASEKDGGGQDAFREVFGPDGACSLLRLSSIMRASVDGNLFDDAFLGYQEDVDVAWRMRRLGMRTALVPEAVAWHHRVAPTAPGRGWWGAWLARWRKPAYVNFLSTRNHVWLLIKHLSWSDLAAHGLWIVPYETAKFAVAVFSRSAMRGYFRAALGVPAMWRERRRLAGMCKLPGKEVRRWFV